MSSSAVADATAATQYKQDDLTLTISPVVFLYCLIFKPYQNSLLNG